MQHHHSKHKLLNYRLRVVEGINKVSSWTKSSVHFNLTKMANQVALLVLSLLCAAIGAFSHSIDWLHPRQVAPRISGGVLAQEGDFRHQVLIRDKRPFRCGGTLIGPQDVLTSAYCCKELSGPDTVVEVGSVLYGRGEEYEISDRFSHDNYDAVTKVNDVCVLHLTEQISLEKSSVLKLGTLDNCQVKTNTKCKVLGWGDAEFSGDSSPALKFAEVLILSEPACSRFYGPLFNDQLMTCAGDIQSGIGACNGDFGGPLVCDEYLCGVVSLRHGCGVSEFPGIFTKVPAVADFIKKNFKETTTD